MRPTLNTCWEFSCTSLPPDEVHDLVFSFPGNAGVRQEHLQEKVQGEKLEHSVHAVPS